MKYFAGLDVSLEETAICMVDETGGIIKEVRALLEQSEEFQRFVLTLP